MRASKYKHLVRSIELVDPYVYGKWSQHSPELGLCCGLTHLWGQFVLTANVKQFLKIMRFLTKPSSQAPDFWENFFTSQHPYLLKGVDAKENSLIHQFLQSLLVHQSPKAVSDLSGSSGAELKKLVKLTDTNATANTFAITNHFVKSKLAPFANSAGDTIMQYSSSMPMHWPLDYLSRMLCRSIKSIPPNLCFFTTIENSSHIMAFGYSPEFNGYLFYDANIMSEEDSFVKLFTCDYKMGIYKKEEGLNNEIRVIVYPNKSACWKALMECIQYYFSILSHDAYDPKAKYKIKTYCPYRPKNSTSDVYSVEAEQIRAMSQMVLEEKNARFLMQCAFKRGLTGSARSNVKFSPTNN